VAEPARGWFGVVTVRDEGIGMDPDTLARAPEPFFTTRSRAGSSGLGLSVAHGAARQAGGHLTMSSLPGVGTTVRLVLPEATTSAHDPLEPDAARPDDRPPGGSETVLVVDDDPSVRGITVRILTDLGYRVLTAADASQALTVVRDEASVDLLVLDVVMPGDSGDELATSARALVGPVPVLYVSGYTDRDAVHSPEPGAGFLAKPFAPRDLAERVRQLLDDRG
jgi:CheY-like chemotaxis protein